MFKNIFENKIGERLTTINSSSKSAMEWMGNKSRQLTQQIDISEKIQHINESQLLKNPIASGVVSAATTIAQNNNININLTNNNNNSANTNNNNNIDNLDIENNSLNTSMPNNNLNSTNETSSSQKQAGLIRQNKVQNGDEIIIDNNENKNQRKTSIKSKSKQPQQTTQQQQQQQLNGEENIDYDLKLKQISEEVMNKNNDKNNSNKNRRNSTNLTNNSKEEDNDFYVNARQLLTRQSTEMTATFPYKAFHGKINSKTIEIPGLNVKVVRYRNMENDIGKIDPNLYRNYSSSKGVDSNIGVSRGKLYFSLKYNEEIQSFSVNINKAELFGPEKSQGKLERAGSTSNSSLTTHRSSFLSSSTPNSPVISKSNTYVKIQLLPDKKRKYQTKIQRKTSNPIFEETFYFATSFEGLQNRTLYLGLYEFGRFLKHELIGAIRISELHLIKDINIQDIEFNRNLLQLAEDDLELGEITITLCYLPAAGRLTVTIVKCDNLKSMDINGKSDPYVKVELITKGKRMKKKKTSVIRNNLNPVYNESMLFDLLQEHVDDVDMIIKVIDYDRVGQNELIGCIGIGPSFNGMGRDHWYRMLENQRKPMTQSYFLRDASFLKDGPARILSTMSEDKRDVSIDQSSVDQ